MGPLPPAQEFTPAPHLLVVSRQQLQLFFLQPMDVQSQPPQLASSFLTSVHPPLLLLRCSSGRLLLCVQLFHSGMNERQESFRRIEKAQSGGSGQPSCLRGAAPGSCLGSWRFSSALPALRSSPRSRRPPGLGCPGLHPSAAALQALEEVMTLGDIYSGWFWASSSSQSCGALSELSLS